MADPKNVLHLVGVPRKMPDNVIQGHLDAYTGITSAKLDSKAVGGLVRIFLEFSRNFLGLCNHVERMNGVMMLRN